MEFNCEEIFTMELKVFPQRRKFAHIKNTSHVERKFIALQAAILKKI